MRPAIMFAVIALVLAVLATAYADMPQTISYQGVLRDDLGEIVPDGTYTMTFWLYSVPSGGSDLWQETKPVTVENGIFNVHLGDVVSLSGLTFADPYWLGIAVDGGPMMDPRTQLDSAPYAMHALTADEAGDDGDWLMDDIFVYRTIGKVGVGTFPTYSILDVASSEGDVALHARSYGLGRSAHFEGGAGVLVEDMLETDAFKMAPGAAEGHVLMSDPSGVGTWQLPSAGGVGGGGTADYVSKFTGATTIGNSVIYESSGNVSIGTTTSDAALRVENSGAIPALIVENSGSTTDYSLVDLWQTGTIGSGGCFVNMVAPVGAEYFLYLHCYQLTEGGFYTPFWLEGDGDIWGIGSLTLENDDLKAISVYTTNESSDAIAVEGRFLGGAYDGIGVRGEAATDDYYGLGGYFKGGFVGAMGRVEPTGALYYYGLNGQCSGGSGTNYGVVGYAAGTGTNHGVYGSALGGATNWAGYFDGDARVTGTFFNPGPMLEMDHPSDPENRYLRHALVASSEMKTIYDGTVVLDASGQSVVELPDWFEALNTDFRYQLTAIGEPGPNLFIAEEVAGNRFRIAGGDAGMKVSWMLTGVRQDAYAEANRIAVEEEKPASERGKYVHPEAHGVSPTLAIGRLEDSEKLKAKRTEVSQDTGSDIRAREGVRR